MSVFRDNFDTSFASKPQWWTPYSVSFPVVDGGYMVNDGGGSHGGTFIQIRILKRIRCEGVAFPSLGSVIYPAISPFLNRQLGFVFLPTGVQLWSSSFHTQTISSSTLHTWTVPTPSTWYNWTYDFRYNNGVNMTVTASFNGSYVELSLLDSPHPTDQTPFAPILYVGGYNGTQRVSKTDWWEIEYDTDFPLLLRGSDRLPVVAQSGFSTPTAAGYGILIRGKDGKPFAVIPQAPTAAGYGSMAMGRDRKPVVFAAQ